jgi:hypothetical protein
MEPDDVDAGSFQMARGGREVSATDEASVRGYERPTEPELTGERAQSRDRALTENQARV